MTYYLLQRYYVFCLSVSRIMGNLLDLFLWNLVEGCNTGQRRTCCCTLLERLHITGWFVPFFNIVRYCRSGWPGCIKASVVAMETKAQIRIQMLHFLFFSPVNCWRKWKGGGRVRPVSWARSLTRFKLWNCLFDKEEEPLRQNVDCYPCLAAVAKRLRCIKRW